MKHYNIQNYIRYKKDLRSLAISKTRGQKI